MFTGLIQGVGQLTERRKNSLTVQTTLQWDDLVYGESIAVNGVCLTLEEFSKSGLLRFHTLDETLKRSNLSLLKLHDSLNLERALRLGDRLGGHLVSGHVDATGTVKRWLELPGGDFELEIEPDDAELLPLIASKGSIAVDGISLTVTRADQSVFAVDIIPVTRRETALAGRKAGSKVNLEADLFARYLARQMEFRATDTQSAKESAITLQMLDDAGFFTD